MQELEGNREKKEENREEAHQGRMREQRTTEYGMRNKGVTVGQNSGVGKCQGSKRRSCIQGEYCV